MIIDSADIVCGRVCVTLWCVSICLSVCLSVPFINYCNNVAGLLLWALYMGDIDRLLHGTSAADVAAF